MEQSILEFVKGRLADLKHADWLQVSEKTGVPIGTIRKIHYGEVADPRIGTLEPLFNYFKSQPKPGASGTRRAAKAA